MFLHKGMAKSGNSHVIMIINNINNLVNLVEVLTLCVASDLMLVLVYQYYSNDLVQSPRRH
jgi:hypothetical protein